MEALDYDGADYVEFAGSIEPETEERVIIKEFVFMSPGISDLLVYPLPKKRRRAHASTGLTRQSHLPSARAH